MRTALFTVTLLLLAGNVFADPQPWMKKENPNELRAYVDVVEGCPNTQEFYQEEVDSVLIRSRIKPLSSATEADDYFYLVVQLMCYDLAPQSSYSFSLHANFGKAVGEELELMLFAEGQTRGTGVGEDDNYIANALRAITEDAITDYLQANFDL